MFDNRCCWWLRLTAVLLCSTLQIHLCQAGCIIDQTKNVDENQPAGTIITWTESKSLRIDRCRDDPLYNQQLVAIKIKEGNWSVQINKEFDAETMPNPMTFDLTCIDTDDTALSLDLTVIINDVDEFPPEFSKPIYEIHIPEDTPVDSIVFSFTQLAKDKDFSSIATSIQYILNSDANGAFVINDHYNGAVQLEKNLDFESGNIIYTLNVSAQDVNNHLMESTALLKIWVTDVDDLNPVFDQNIYNLQIQEGTYTGSELFRPNPTLSARDGDTAINQTIYFSLDLSSKAQYNSLFDISKNGSLALNGTVKPGKYSINVRAYQVDKPSFRYAVAILVLTVTDINNNKPVLSSSHYSADVSELSPLGTTVLTVSASDLDEGDNAVFKFFLQSDVSSSGVFDVITDQTLGYIILNQTLDREQKASYTFQVYAKEIKTQERFESSHSNVTIKVLDENDNSPIFNASYYSFRINRTATGVIGQVLATDADSGPNGVIVYSLQNSYFTSAVAIDSKTGRISLTRNLLRSDVGTYSIITVATDSSIDVTKRRSSLAAVVIQVSPVNDNAPSFVGSQPYIFNVPETTSANSLIGQISAVDSDGDSIEYFIKSGNEDNYVRLDSSSGQLYLIKENDLDATSVVTSYLALNASASDGLYNTTTEVHLQFTYVNEFDPVFTSVPVGTVAENSRKGANITKVVATDKDIDGVLTYSLVPLSYSSIFSIDPQTGWISLACDTCLNYDTRTSYDIVVKVEDGGNPSRQSLTSVTINVTKTAFAKPHFVQKMFFFQVLENSVNYFQLDATDPDTPRTQLAFSIAAPYKPDAGVAFFVNVINNGTVGISAIDAEKYSSITFGVNVTDGINMDTAVVFINVTDVNDNDPVLVMQSPVNVLENAQSGQNVLTVSASDKDISNSGFTYYIETGTDGKFQIHPSSGVITTAGQFDRRQKSVYNFSVNVLDHGSPPRLASQFLVVNIVDSNTAPVFVNSLTTRLPVAEYNFTVPEDTSVGSHIGHLYAYDPDFGSSGQLKYDITFQDPKDFFSLGSADGQLTLNKMLNYEIKNKYQLIAIVSDNSYQPKTATATVDISVQNIIEAPEWPLPLPVIYFTQTSTCSPQLQALSQEVTTLSSRGDEFVEYKLLNHTNLFRINSSTGDLQVINSLTTGTYFVGLTACANGTTVCSNASLIVVVSTGDSLMFCPAFVNIMVNESLYSNKLLQDLDTNKGDSGVQYSITSGNSDKNFWINSTDGKLYVNGILDRETTHQYMLTVTATQATSKETAQAQVIINVLDLPDTAPVFQLNLYSGEISESDNVGGPVKLPESSIPLRVQATDQDLNPVLIYSIDPASDTSSGSFSVDSSTGAIYLAKKIDFETMPKNLNRTYSFIVTVSDGVFNATTQVQVKILDANDNAPIFVDSSPTVISVQEDTKPIKVLGTVIATDADSIDYGKLVYKITSIYPSGRGNPFKIEAETGNIVLEDSLDRETIENYVLFIIVEDLAGHTATKEVHINVLDVNDNGPYFLNTTYFMNVTEENEGVGTKILLEAVDKDKDNSTNAEITYSIVSGNGEKYFKLMIFEDKWHFKTIKALDREELVKRGSTTLQVIVKAEDIVPVLNGPSSSTCTVMVTVLDINDNWPVFSNEAYSGQVLETAVDDTPIPLVPPVAVNDPDFGDNGTDGVVFSLKSESTFFRINKTTGQLYVSLNGNHLDRETKDVYTMEIIAADKFGAGKSSSANVTITILDVNDEKPEFNQSSYSFTVSEKEQVDAVVGYVYAKDKDRGTTLYYLKGSSSFVILPLDGKIIVSGYLDRRVQKSFLLNVSACDVELPEGCNSVNVTINVTDTNDHCPVWNTSSLYMSVSEANKPFDVVGHLVAVDEDDDNGVLTYFTNDTAVKSFINVTDTGDVKLLQVIENSQTFKFPVFARDGGNPACTQRADIEIKVDGVNKHDPVICNNNICGVAVVNMSVLDNAKAGSVIGYITSYDNDTGINGQTHFYFSDNPFINITNSGFITLKKDIVKSEVFPEFIVWVVDSGFAPRNSSTVLHIIIEPSLSVRPVFTKISYTFSVPENSAFYGDVRANQSDGKSVNYSLVAGEDGLPFNIFNNGTIHNIKNLDRETEERYEFIVSAFVANNIDMYTWALVRVLVTDVNDNPPVFDDSEMTVTVLENTNQTLTQLLATDADEGSNRNVTYYLTDPANYPQFSINAETGVLSVVMPLDREKQASYTLYIVARDGGTPSNSATATVQVLVADVNDNPPIFSQPSYVFNIKSFGNISQILYPVSATDADEGANQVIVYTLEEVPDDSKFFYIDPLTGVLSTVQRLSKPFYTLRVKASDLGSPSLFSLANVTFNVLDSDIKPTLTVQPDSITLYVGMLQGTILEVTVNYSNAQLINISEGNENQVFKFVNKKIILAQDLTRPMNYNLSILASNRPVTEQTTSVILKVFVRSVEFDQLNYLASVPENYKNLPKILCQLRSAAQMQVNVSYKLNNFNDLFQLASGTGQLSVVKLLDREMTSVYILNVSVTVSSAGQAAQGRKKRQASSGGGGYASVIVQVEDENDNAPTFGSGRSNLYFNVPASAVSDSVVAQIQAFDPDEGLNGLIFYKIENGNVEEFKLNSQNGELTVKNSTGFSSKPQWDLTISATDRNGTGNVARVNVTIYVQNMSSYTLQAAVPLSLFKDNQQSILEKLGNILGFKVNFINASVIKDSSCVITFSALDLKSNATVSTDEIGKKVQDKLADITELFNSYLKTGKSSSNTDEGAYNTTSIVLIVIGCVMFVASLLAILVAYLMWKKQRHYAEKEENAARVREKLGEQMTHKASNASSDPDEHLEMRETKVDVEEQESVIAFKTEFKSDISTVALRHSLVDMKTQHMQQLFQSISEEEDLGSSQRPVETRTGSNGNTRFSSLDSGDRESNIYTNISLSGRNDELLYKQDEDVYTVLRKNVTNNETQIKEGGIQSVDDKLEDSEPDYQEIPSIVNSVTSPADIHSEFSRLQEADGLNNAASGVKDDHLSSGKPDVTDGVADEHLSNAEKNDLEHPPSVSDESDTSSDEEITYF